MEIDGVIELPLPTRESLGMHEVTLTSASDAQEPITGSRGDFPHLQWQLLERGSAAARLWSEFVRRYHPLHSAHMAGPQLRYLAVVDDRVLACLDFGSPALKLADRDRWIGWTPRGTDHPFAPRGAKSTVSGAPVGAGVNVECLGGRRPLIT
jgi:hypothetical protein